MLNLKELLTHYNLPWANNFISYETEEILFLFPQRYLLPAADGNQHALQFRMIPDKMEIVFHPVFEHDRIISDDECSWFRFRQD